MTGTINATIVGDDYSLRPRPRVPGVHLRRPDVGPHQSRRGDAEHDERSGARARQRRVGQRRKQHRDARVPGGGDHARRARRPRRADDARRHVSLSGDRHHGRPATPWSCRCSATSARRRASSPTRATATIAAIDIRRGTRGDHRRCAVADITNRAWSGKLHVERAERGGAAGPDVRRAWRVAGPLSADAILGGTFDDFRLDTTINGTRADVGRPGDRSRHRQGDRHRARRST